MLVRLSLLSAVLFFPLAAFAQEEAPPVPAPVPGAQPPPGPPEIPAN